MRSLDNKDVRQRLSRFSNLPSIPQVILQIREIADDPKATPADLANVILSDQQLTGRILRMANSAYYSDYSGKITTVTHAIVVMGFRAVHNIALSMGIYGVMNDFTKRRGFDLVAFWTRSLACGIIAKMLTRLTGHQKLLETAFIAGFLHDIGQVILAGAFPDKYEQIGRLDPMSPDICETERILLGMDHQEVGEYVAHTWNLPEILIRPMSEHHQDRLSLGNSSSDLLVGLVGLGDLICPHALAGTEPSDDAFTTLVERVRAVVKITDRQLADLLVECRRQVAEVAQDLEIDIQGELDRRIHRESDLDALHHQLHNKEVQLAFLQNAINALMEAKSEGEILQIVCEAMYRGLQMGRVILFEYYPDYDEFCGKVGFGVTSQRDIHRLCFSARDGLFGTLRQSAQPVTIVDQNPEIYGGLVNEDERERLEADSFVALPMRLLGEVKFVVFADNRNRKKAIEDEALRSMMSLVNQGAMSLERHLFERKLHEPPDDTGQ